MRVVVFVLIISIIFLSGCVAKNMQQPPAAVKTNVTNITTAPTPYEAPTFEPIRKSNITVIPVRSPTTIPATLQTIDSIVGVWKITNTSQSGITAKLTFLPEGDGYAIASPLFFGGNYEYRFTWNRTSDTTRTYNIHTEDYGDIKVLFNSSEEDRGFSEVFGNNSFMIRE